MTLRFTMVTSRSFHLVDIAQISDKYSVTDHFRVPSTVPQSLSKRVLRQNLC